MLRLGCVERKEKGKTRDAGGPERATAHFRSSVAIGFLWLCVATGPSVS